MGSRLGECVVRLRSPGFESSVVTPPLWGEGSSLAWFLQHPARASPTAFVTALLATCLVPTRRQAEVAALPESDRAALRRAMIAACGREREWHRLYGSHLSGDERLMAVMVWRWSAQERTLARLREIHREFAETTDASGGTSALPADIGGIAAAFTPQRAFQSITVFRKLATPFPVFRKLPRLVSPQPALIPKLPSYPAPLLRVPKYPKLALGPANRSPIDATVLGLGEPPWLQTVKHMTTAVALHRGVVSQLNLGLRPFASSSRLRTAALSFVDIHTTFSNIVASLRELGERLEQARRFMFVWERRALWFLLARLGLRAWRWLADLDPAEVEEVILDALEVVVTDGEVIPALREAVANAPYLTPFQRPLLDNMLEQAAERAYITACGSMYLGVEGAFAEIGCARMIITPDRRWTQPPHKPISFDAMVKRLQLKHEGFESFIVKAVFGTAGNPYRHGYADADAGVRRQVLFGVAALAGWLQEFAGVEALDMLGIRLEGALPAALEPVRRRR